MGKSQFTGRGMHDRLAAYDGYDCAHSICGAHLLRDCQAVTEQEQQPWATDMHDFLLDLNQACQHWRKLNLFKVPAMKPRQDLGNSGVQERLQKDRHSLEVLSA